MKKQILILFSSLLIFFAAFPAVQAQADEVATQLTDEQFDVTFEVLKDDSDDISATSEYIDNTARIVVEEGKTYAEVTLKSAAWWQSLKTQTTQPGSFEDENFIDAEIISEDEAENTRVVKFEIPDLSQVLNAKIHIIVTGIPGIDSYDSSYDIRLKFNESEEAEEPDNSEQEAPEEVLGEISDPTTEGIVDGAYTIDFNVLHETNDETSRMSSYIGVPALLTVKDSENIVTFTLTNNEQITAFQIELDDAYVDETVVNIDEDANTRTVSFVINDFSIILNAKVQIHVAAQNYTSEHIVRLSFDQDSITSQSTPIENTKTFSDITTSWAKEYIESLATQDIIQGMSEDTFAPEDHITRAQFAVLLSRTLELPTQAYEGTFSDVTEELAWAVFEVEAANRAEIVFGSDGKFNPNEQITREQMVAMIVRAIEYKDATVLEGVDSDVSFADEATISDYAKEYVGFAVGLDIINGMEVNGESVFAPAENATRAQAAKVIYHLLEVL